MLSLCVIFGPDGWGKHWAQHWTAARQKLLCECVCVCVCTRGRIFSRFHLFRSRSCMGVNINHPKVCLRVCTCECVNTSVSKSLMLTTVALRCSELREGDPQRPTFYVKKHLHLYIITLKKTELEEQNYMCGAKVGKKLFLRCQLVGRGAP